MSPMRFPIGSRQDHNSLPDEGSSPSSDSAPATNGCRVPLTVASRGVVCLGPIGIGPFVLPLQLSGFRIEGQELRRLFLLELLAHQTAQAIVNEGTVPDGDVVVMRSDRFGPEEFPVEVEGGQDGGAEQDVHPFAVTSWSSSAV